MRSSDDDSAVPLAFDLYSKKIDADPFPHYRWLRDEYPCYWSWSARNGIWILSRYHGVRRPAQDWRTFSSSSGNMTTSCPDVPAPRSEPAIRHGTTDSGLCVSRLSPSATYRSWGSRPAG